VPAIHRGHRLRSGQRSRWIALEDDLTESEKRLFSQPLALAELGRFVIRVYRDALARRGWRRADGEVVRKPLFLSVRHRSAGAGGGGGDDGSWVTVMGLPVVAEEGDEAAASFLVPFQEAAEACGAKYMLDSFNFCSVVLKVENVLPFFENLEETLPECDD